MSSTSSNEPRTDHSTENSSTLATSQESLCYDRYESSSTPTKSQNSAISVYEHKAAFSRNDHDRTRAVTKTFWTFTGQQVVAFFYQTITIIVAVVFGIWAILTYYVAVQANQLTIQSIQGSNAEEAFSAQQTLIANHIGLFIACQEGVFGYYDLSATNIAFCRALIGDVDMESIAIAVSLTTIVPSAVPTATTTENESSVATAGSTETPLTSGSGSFPTSPPATVIAIGPGPVRTSANVSLSTTLSSSASSPPIFSFSGRISSTLAPSPTTINEPIPTPILPVGPATGVPLSISLGAIIGITVPVIVLAALLAVFAWKFYSRRKQISSKV